MKWVLIFLVLGALSASGAVFLLDMNKSQEPVPAVVAQEDVVEEQQDPAPEEVLSIEKKFENFLNGFLQDVNKQVGEYRKQRKVLVEAVRPLNLRSPAYVKENYLMMQRTAPELRQKMEALMQTFSDADDRVKRLISSEPQETQDAILAEWQKMKDKQVAHYITFFMTEDDLIKVYEQLMAFYYQTASTFTVDTVNNLIVFESPEDEVRNLAFLKTIAGLSKKQEEAMKSR